MFPTPRCDREKERKNRERLKISSSNLAPSKIVRRQEEEHVTIRFQNFETAAQPYGPYSHVVTAGPFVFLSGHSGRDIQTGKVITGDITAQAEQALLNIEAVLKGVGLGFEHIVRTTIYLADIADFAAVNAVYEKKFSRGFPARSTFQVTLPFGALVAFDAIAYKG